MVMTLEELELLVKEARSPQELFGKDIEKKLRAFSFVCHPDRNPGNPRAEQLFKNVHSLAEEAKQPPVVITSPNKSKRKYTLLQMLASGDVSDLFLAEADGKDYLAKISRFDGAASLLDSERKVIGDVLTLCGDTNYSKYFPTLVESFPAKQTFPKRVNVFTYERGFYTLEDVKKKYPDGIDGKHVAWMFKRLLTGIGLAHRAGYVHGAVVPPHVLIQPDDHGLRLVGWIHSVKMGDRITGVPAAYKSWYPPEVLNKQSVSVATDVYLAARCMSYVAGHLNKLPTPLRQFVGSCLLDGQAMRPDDAWRLLDEFDELLRMLYGPPKFVHFHMEGV